MNGSKKTRLKLWLRLAVLAALVVIAALVLVVWSGLADRWARSAIIGQLVRMTGGRVELGRFHFQPLRLRAELTDLTIHGREPEGTPPFFHAENLFVDIRIDSLWRRKISLNEVRLGRPAVHVRIERDGTSNVPSPPHRKASRPWNEGLFELVIRRLRLDDGTLEFNDVRVPLVAEGGQFRLAMNYSAPAVGKDFYVGQMSWQQMVLAARRYIPFPSDLAAKFTLTRNALDVNQVRWTLPHSELDVQATLTNFAEPSWSLRYRARLSLDDFRAILRKPNSPRGAVEFSGEGTYAAKNLDLRGHYAAHEIAMPYQWFHTRGIESRGSYHADTRGVEVPDFEARVLGGNVQGRVQMVFHGQRFRAETHAHGLSLAAVLAAVDNPSLPVSTLHWAGNVDVNSVSTWTEDFKHLDSSGLSLWSPPIELGPGEIPASARLEYHFVMDRRAAELAVSTIATPTSVLKVGGVLAARDSALNVALDAQQLEPWNDFINRLRGAAPWGDLQPERIAGRAQWQGRVLGPIDGPTFVGHAKGLGVSYGRLRWDEVEGDVTYSPKQFRFERARAGRGRSLAQFELSLELDNWGFHSENQWTLEANLDRAATDDLQELLGWSYPAHGLLTGQFRGSGTRADPRLTGLFELAEVDAWGYRLDRFRGQLNLRGDEIRISNAELRLAPGAAPATGNHTSRPPGVLTGNFLYRRSSREVAFDLTGAGIPLERIQGIQTRALPLGGQLSFQVSGKGPLDTLAAQGTLRLVDLRVGNEVLGSFDGKLNSDGRLLHLDVSSAMSTGRLQGKLDVTLAGDYPIEGDLTIQAIDLDPFIQAGLHLRALTGHSSVDGRFLLNGALGRPQTLAVQADISRLVFDYQYVKLENVGPLRFSYRRDEVRIEQAHLRGLDTDLNLSGWARFAGDRRLDLSLTGTVNLRLAGGFVPQLEARGPAQVNASIQGTLSNPRIIGRVHVENAAANYDEFPAGLSRVAGDFVFDTSRLLFENVTAETGGGQLTLGGTLTYGEGPLRYDLTLRADQIRIRYPEGMSWIAGGALRLSGSTQAGVLSGQVVVQRLLMAQGVDLAGIIVAAKEPGRTPSTTSPFLRNLQFEIQAVSTPDARIEWSSARLESEANVRIRGTWEHPILLGHVHLLGGEMTFRGNRYRLARGDINFSNPFRLDPVLNVEAVTTIRQYEVTLDFTGPASRLTLAFRSDPPLPSSDVIALLALGQTSEQSGLRGPTAVQTPELGATTLLSEAISSQLGGRIERLFGISRFRVDPFLAGTATEQNAPARVTIEQQVKRDLVITYITNVTSTQQQVIQVEYNLSRRLSIVALRDQNGTFGLDIVFRRRFK
jgi:translocation and assembly module TamB